MSDFAEAKLATVILDVAVASVDADGYLSEIVRHLTDHLRCSYAGIVLFDDGTNIGCISRHGNIELQRIPRTTFPTSDKCICSTILRAQSSAPSFRLTKAGSIFRNHKPMPDKSARGKRGNAPWGLCIGNNIESAALVPIKCRGAIEGVLIVADEHKNTLPLKTVESLERFACYLGIIFKSLRAYDQTSHRSPTPVTKESELATRDNELMTLLMDNANESILISQDWRIVYVNRQCARLAGMSQQDMIGMHILDLTHPDDRETIRERYTDIVNNRSFPGSVISRGFDKDGNIRWAEVRGIPFSWNGRFAVLSLINDITERKKAEENLKASEDRFRAIIEHSRDAIAILDGDYKATFESASLKSVTGYEPEEWIGKSINEMAIHPDDLASLASKLEILKNQPGLAIEDVTVRYRHKDGSWHVIEASARNLLHDPKVKGIVVNYRDVTHRKQMESALEESERKYRTLAEQSLQGIMIVQDIPPRIIYCNNALANIIGFTVEEMLSMTSEQAGNLVHPDDRIMFFERYAAIISGVPTEQHYEFRAVHKNGSVLWLEIFASRIEYEGRPAMQAAFIDITERKRAVEALLDSEQHYRLLAENILDVIYLIDLNLRPIYVSTSISKLLGYSIEEVLARKLETILTPDSFRIVLDALHTALAQEEIEQDTTPRELELELIKKDGSTVWTATTVNFVRDQQGRPKTILGVLRDISDRKTAEKSLRESEQRYRFLAENVSDVIWVTDMNLKPTFFSPSVARLLGYSVEEAMEGTLDSRLTSDSAKLARLIFEEALVREKENIKRAPRKRTIELEMIRKDGSTVWTETTVSFLRSSDGELFGVLGVLRDITERRKAEQALRDSERRYRLLAENITDVIWTTDMDLRVTYVSPSAARLLGFTIEELMNMTVQDMLTPSSFEYGMKLLAEQKAIRDARQDDSPHIWTAEVTLRCKDGSTVCAEVKVTFLQDHDGKRIGLLGVTRDITENKRMEKALRLSEQKYRTIVEASPDGILSIDHHGIITDCNMGLCRMLGYEREELCGSDARRLGTQKDLDMEAQFTINLIQGNFMEFETEVVRKDGQTSPVWAKLVKLPEPTPPNIQTIVYLRDITDRKKIDQMKDEFIGLVSHELRSPLTVIIGAINTAISEGPRLSQKEVRQLLLDASLEADQLSHLVGNLLELSRAQVNRLLLHVEPVDLSRVVHKVSNTVQRRSPKHRFIIDLPKRMPPVVADRLRLERILYNLLENSVKYSPEGSETRISAKCEDNHVVVAVSDQGPGISPEDQARLFRPFQQLGNPVTDHTKGAGLGLLVCRRLVEAHGGRIWVESELNHGSTFYFTLNLSANQNGRRHRQ